MTMMRAFILCIVLLSKTSSGSSRTSYRPHPTFINHIYTVVKARPSKIVTAQQSDETLFDAEEAAAIDAHDVSDAGVEGAAMERAVIMAAEFKKQQQKEKENDILKIRDAEAQFAHDLSDVAAVEHAEEYTKADDESRIASLAIASVEEHYRSIDKDIKTIEHLIEEAAKADQSEV